MKIQLSSITATLVALFVVQSNAVIIGSPNSLTNSVISNYRIQPRVLPTDNEPKLIQYLGFVSKNNVNGNATVTVELHPNDDFALERCRVNSLLYEMLNFQLQLYLSIEQTNFQPDLLPVCKRVEKCAASMHTMASRSEAFEERLFSPMLLVLKQLIGTVCDLERKESKMNVNTIVDTTKSAYNQLMALKNLVKTVTDISLF